MKRYLKRTLSLMMVVLLFFSCVECVIPIVANAEAVGYTIASDKSTYVGTATQENVTSSTSPYYNFRIMPICYTEWNSDCNPWYNNPNGSSIEITYRKLYGTSYQTNTVAISGTDLYNAGIYSSVDKCFGGSDDKIYYYQVDGWIDGWITNVKVTMNKDNNNDGWFSTNGCFYFTVSVYNDSTSKWVEISDSSDNSGWGDDDDSGYISGKGTFSDSTTIASSYYPKITSFSYTPSNLSSITQGASSTVSQAYTLTVKDTYGKSPYINAAYSLPDSPAWAYASNSSNSLNGKVYIYSGSNTNGSTIKTTRTDLTVKIAVNTFSGDQSTTALLTVIGSECVVYEPTYANRETAGLSCELLKNNAAVTDNNCTLNADGSFNGTYVIKLTNNSTETVSVTAVTKGGNTTRWSLSNSTASSSSPITIVSGDTYTMTLSKNSAGDPVYSSFYGTVSITYKISNLYLNATTTLATCYTGVGFAFNAPNSSGTFQNLGNSYIDMDDTKDHDIDMYATVLCSYGRMISQSVSNRSSGSYDNDTTNSTATIDYYIDRSEATTYQGAGLKFRFESNNGSNTTFQADDDYSGKVTLGGSYDSIGTFSLKSASAASASPGVEQLDKEWSTAADTVYNFPWYGNIFSGSTTSASPATITFGKGTKGAGMQNSAWHLTAGTGRVYFIIYFNVYAYDKTTLRSYTSAAANNKPYISAFYSDGSTFRTNRNKAQYTLANYQVTQYAVTTAASGLGSTNYLGTTGDYRGYTVMHQLYSGDRNSDIKQNVKYYRIITSSGNQEPYYTDYAGSYNKCSSQTTLSTGAGSYTLTYYYWNIDLTAYTALYNIANALLDDPIIIKTDADVSTYDPESEENDNEGVTKFNTFSTYLSSTTVTNILTENTAQPLYDSVVQEGGTSYNLIYDKLIALHLKHYPVKVYEYLYCADPDDPDPHFENESVVDDYLFDSTGDGTDDAPMTYEFYYSNPDDFYTQYNKTIYGFDYTPELNPDFMQYVDSRDEETVRDNFTSTGVLNETGFDITDESTYATAYGKYYAQAYDYSLETDFYTEMENQQASENGGHKWTESSWTAYQERANEIIAELSKACVYPDCPKNPVALSDELQNPSDLVVNMTLTEANGDESQQSNIEKFREAYEFTQNNEGYFCLSIMEQFEVQLPEQYDSAVSILDGNIYDVPADEAQFLADSVSGFDPTQYAHDYSFVCLEEPTDNTEGVFAYKCLICDELSPETDGVRDEYQPYTDTLKPLYNTTTGDWTTFTENYGTLQNQVIPTANANTLTSRIISGSSVLDYDYSLRGAQVRLSTVSEMIDSQPDKYSQFKNNGVYLEYDAIRAGILADTSASYTLEDGTEYYGGTQALRFRASMTIPVGATVEEVGFLYAKGMQFYNEGDVCTPAGGVTDNIENFLETTPGVMRQTCSNYTLDMDTNGAYTFNLVINVNAKNWRHAYAARGYITYTFGGQTFTVYDSSYTCRSVQYIMEHQAADDSRPVSCKYANALLDFVNAEISAGNTAYYGSDPWVVGG